MSASLPYVLMAIAYSFGIGFFIQKWIAEHRKRIAAENELADTNRMLVKAQQQVIDAWKERDELRLRIMIWQGAGQN